jgi:hypothetical protein
MDEKEIAELPQAPGTISWAALVESSLDGKESSMHFSGAKSQRLDETWIALRHEVHDLLCTHSAKYAKERSSFPTTFKPAIAALAAFLSFQDVLFDRFVRRLSEWWNQKKPITAISRSSQKPSSITRSVICSMKRLLWGYSQKRNKAAAPLNPGSASASTSMISASVKRAWRIRPSSAAI